MSFLITLNEVVAGSAGFLAAQDDSGWKTSPMRGRYGSRNTRYSGVSKPAGPAALDIMNGANLYAA